MKQSLLKRVFPAAFLLALLMMPKHPAAQNIPVKSLFSIADTVDSEDKPAGSIILNPAADPYLFYDPVQDIFQIQSGLFIGSSHIGVETTFRRTESDRFGNIFMGVVSGSKPGSSAEETFVIGGLAYGSEYILNSYRIESERKGPEFYFRLSPGIGLAGRGVFTEFERDFYFGIHTTAIMGAQFRITDRTSFFMNGGGRVLWFPALNEVGLMGVPVISFGIQFTTSPQLPMIRY
jgi:hypothetical protein